MAAAVTFWLRVPDREGNMNDAASSSETGNLHAAQAGSRNNAKMPTRRGSGAHPEALSVRTFLWLIGVGICLLWLLAASASAQSINGPSSPSFVENGTGPVANYTISFIGVSWSVSGTDSSHFNISNGILRFNNAPNYDVPGDADTGNDYEILIGAVSGSNSAYKSVTVNVTDEGPSISISGSTTVNFQENGTGVVVTLEAIEFEGTVTWELPSVAASEDYNDFNISGRGFRDRHGDLTFKISPDYESPDDANNNNEYKVRVAAKRGSYNESIDITVNVTDQDEPPVVSGSTTINFLENSTAAVATYTATDPEGGTTFTWSLSGDDSEDFTISPAGVLRFSSAPDYESPADANTNNVYRVTVRASDGSETGTLGATVTVTNENEPPVLSGNTTIQYADQGTVAVHTYTATDPEGGVHLYLGPVRRRQRGFHHQHGRRPAFQQRSRLRQSRRRRHRHRIPCHGAGLRRQRDRYLGRQRHHQPAAGVVRGDGAHVSGEQHGQCQEQYGPGRLFLVQRSRGRRERVENDGGGQRSDQRQRCQPGLQRPTRLRKSLRRQHRQRV